MNKHSIFKKRVALLALFALAAPLAHADIYRWVEEDGNVTFSDTPPADKSKVYELSKIPTPPRATAAPQAAARPGEKLDPLFANAPAASRDAAPASQPQIAVTPGEPLRAEAPRVSYRGIVGAAQDPCLRSADPRCYERNKESYHPRYGYMGGATAAAPTAVGATGGSSGGGTVGGTFTR